MLLVVGAELLVRGASALAVGAGVSPLVVGLTVVAFGTSAPELAVSLQSALGGQADIAVGNVLGSNIANVLLILGVSACVTPLAVQMRLLRIEVPLLIFVTGLAYLFAWQGSIGRVEGLIFVCGAVAYTVFAVRQSRRESAAIQAEFAEAYGPADGDAKPASIVGIIVQILFVVAGLGVLVFGADLLVDGAVRFARGFGVSELMIGLTIVAVGTSLPELAASLVAAARGERDIAVGNVIGSNLFNLLFVLGGAAMIVPVPVADQAIHLDFPVALGAAVLCVPVFFTGSRVSRLEGALFLGGYVLYVAWLISVAAGGP